MFSHDSMSAKSPAFQDIKEENHVRQQTTASITTATTTQWHGQCPDRDQVERADEINTVSAGFLAVGRDEVMNKTFISPVRTSCCEFYHEALMSATGRSRTRL